MKTIFTALLIALLAVPCLSLHTFINEGQKWCLSEEIPENTLVVSKFKFSYADDSPVESRQMQPTLGVDVVVRDPREEIILKQKKTKEARVAFTSQEAGDHNICLQTNTTRWFGAARRLRVDFEVSVGSNAIDYDSIAKADDLSSIDLRFRRINDRLTGIQAELSYQKDRETSFRNTSESTNSRVMWWSALQLIVVGGSAVFQVFHLKGFFKNRKLM
eukprot:TRINITY_DN34293_c0_g1_i1.p1 TRINITY_DN34293_c0_g1~~TRINITY_DN34293_c0_g1_i1.p1  ORF type:complete len:217 (+),score=57.21 TRINITY_DN34293_c0_g1_i1:43-693(+)